MKSILCYGDSNTWGFDIEGWMAGGMRTPVRFGPEVRWPGVLAASLGPGYRIIEEGLNGRTTVYDDPVEGKHKNGSRCLMACLESHAPLDVFILMLGTNDLKVRFSTTAGDIAEGAATLARTILSTPSGPGGSAPRLIIVAPFPLGEGIRSSPYGEMFGWEEGVAKSRLLADRFRAIAKTLDVTLVDSGEVVTAHPLDSLHLSPESHRKLGKRIAETINQ